nr:hypothetical protein [Coxiella burnetii]
MRMSEAKYGENNDVIIVPVFRFAHTGYWLKLHFKSFGPIAW